MQKTFTFNSKPKCCVKANDRLYPVADYDAKTNRIKKKPYSHKFIETFFMFDTRQQLSKNNYKNRIHLDAT